MIEKYGMQEKYKKQLDKLRKYLKKKMTLKRKKVVVKAKTPEIKKPAMQAEKKASVSRMRNTLKKTKKAVKRAAAVKAAIDEDAVKGKAKEQFKKMMTQQRLDEMKEMKKLMLKQKTRVEILKS